MFGTFSPRYDGKIALIWYEGSHQEAQDICNKQHLEGWETVSVSAELIGSSRFRFHMTFRRVWA